MDDTGGVPGNAACQLTALEPSIANTNDILMIEGTFADAVTVSFPGGASVAATVLGSHRARVSVPASATQGDLTIASCGSTLGPLPFRRASFTLGVGSFQASLEQTDGAHQNVSLETAREQHTSVVIGAHVYIIGGTGSTGGLISLERASLNADGSLGAFERASDVNMVTARAGHTATVIGHTLYVLGGLGGAPLNSVERSTIGPDLSLGSFSIVGDVALTTARYGHASVVIGNYLYALGGFGNTFLDSIERAVINTDGSLGAFAVVPGVTLTMARRGHTAAVVGNFLYVLGGTRGGTVLQDVERASINSDGSLGAFAPVSASLARPRSGHTVEVLGNYVYVIGGSDGDVPLNSVERAPLSDTGAVGSFAELPAVTLTNGRRGHTTVVAANYVYAIGGVNSGLLNSVERATINNSSSVGAFATVAGISLTPARASHTIAALGNNLYVIGGSDGPTSVLSRVDRASVAADGSLEPFTSTTDVELVTPRGGHADAVIGGYLYVLPGFGVQTFERAPISGDGSLGAFVTVPDAAFVTARFGFATAVVGGYLYALGGGSDSFEPLNSVERAAVRPDGSVNAFELVPGAVLTTARQAHTSVQLGSFLYVLGGSNSTITNNTDPLRSVERTTVNADGSLSQFTQLVDVALTIGRFGHTIVVVGNYLYVLGGVSSSGLLNSIERASIAPDGTLGPFTVVSGITLVAARTGFAAAVAGSYLYVVGGTGGPSRLNSIERATLNADGSLGRFTALSKP